MSKKFSSRVKKKIRTRIWFCMVFVAVVTASAAFFVYSNRETKTKQVDSSFESQDFGYEQIRDDGSFLQIKNLLHELRTKNLFDEQIPVQLDAYQRAVEISDTVIKHPECTESDRVFAIRSKLEALGKSYSVALTNNLSDPFIAEQLIGTSELYSEDKDDNVARDALVSLARGVVYETIKKRFLGGADRVEDSMVNLLERFSDDPVVLGQVRDLFTQYRSFDAEASRNLASKIAAVTDKSESEETRELSRFMKDILVLYETGIGNFKSIGQITVGDEEFMRRLRLLNADTETGPTAVRQLDNAIDYFERNENYAFAKQLSEFVLESVPNRSHEAAAALAKKVAEAGIKRNSLIGQIWDFTTQDAAGNLVAAERFKGRVVLVAFNSTQGQNSVLFEQNMLKLTHKFFGRPFNLIMVEVGDEEKSVKPSLGQQQWVTVRSTTQEPHKYLQQCPTKRLPFGLLIDKNGIVDSVNVDFQAINTRIENLIATD